MPGITNQWVPSHPNTVTVLNWTAGTAYDVDFNFFHSDGTDPNSDPLLIGFSTSESPTLIEYYQNGASIPGLPGIQVVCASTSPVSINDIGSPTGLRLVGTPSIDPPTAFGTAHIYVRGTYSYTVDNNGIITLEETTIVAKYDITVSGTSLAISSPTTGTTLTEGTVGSAYTAQAIIATSGGVSYDWSIDVLPAGMGLAIGPSGSGVDGFGNSILSITTVGSTVYLVGTPTASAVATDYVITCQANSSWTSATYNLTVTASGGAGTLPLHLAGITQNSVATNTILEQLPTVIQYGVVGNAGAGPYTYDILSGTVPTGLSLVQNGDNPRTASLTGTPTAYGTFNFVLRVTDSTPGTPNVGTQDYALVIVNNLVITGTLYNGTESVLYTNNGAGISLQVAGSTTLPNTDGSYIWTVDNDLPYGIDVWDKNKRIVQFGGSPLLGTAGVHHWGMRVTVKDVTSPYFDTFQTIYFYVTIAPDISGNNIVISASPSTASPDTITVTQGVAATITLTGTGGSGTATWSIDSGTPLPAGLSLNTSSGVISGTPTGYNNINNPPSIIINVVKSVAGTGSHSYRLKVIPNLTYSVTTLPGPCVAGTPYTTDVTVLGADNADYIVGASNLPAGITATSPANNVLRFSGTPTANSGGVPIPIGIFITTHVDLIGSTLTFPTQTFNLTITGSSVVITPFATQEDGRTSSAVKLGAIVTGGTTNRFNISVSGTIDALSPATGPYDSYQQIYLFTGASVESHTVTYTSVDDNTVTATTTVNVTSGSPITATVTPPGPEFLHYGDPAKTFTALVSGGSNLCTSLGIWQFLEGLNGGGSNPSNFLGATTSYTPKAAALATDTNQIINLGFNPHENTDVRLNIPIYLLAGVGIDTFSITTSNTLTTATQNVPYSISLAASGATGQVHYSIFPGSSSPPAGITVSDSGVIAGTPTTNGIIFTFVVLAVDNAHTTAKQFTLTVTAAGGTPTFSSIVTPTGSTSGPVGGGTDVTITGTGFAGGDTVLFERALENAPGVFTALGSLVIVNSTTITGTTAAWTYGPGPVDVNIYRSGNVIASGPAKFQFTQPGGSFALTSYTPLEATAGRNTPLTLRVEGDGFDTSTIVTYTDHPISGGGSVNSLSTQVLQDSFGHNYLLATLPSTYFVNNTYVGTVGEVAIKRLSDSPPTIITSPVAFQVKAANLVIATTVQTLGAAIATRGSSYSFTLTATGGELPLTWSIIPSNALPAGLTLAPSTGIISGTPTSGALTALFQVSVIDSAGTRTTSPLSTPYRLNIRGGALSLDSVSPLPDGRLDASYSPYTFIGSGGVGAYSWTLTSGALPSGITLDAPTGVLSGTPSSSTNTNTTYTFTALVTDSTGGTPLSTPKAFSLKLNGPAVVVTVTSITPPFGSTSGGQNFTIAGSGFLAGAVVRFGNNLATGVSVSSTNSLTCTSPQGNTGLVTISVANGTDPAGSLVNGFEYRPLSTPIITGVSVQDGPFGGGQTVILRGSNFANVSDVSFGVAGSKASAVITSKGLSTNPQTLTVTTPAYTFVDGNTAYPVIIFVTNSASPDPGVLGAEPNGYTYRPPPIITDVVPNSGSTNGGSTFYILGRNFFQRNGLKPKIFIGNIEIDSASITFIES